MGATRHAVPLPALTRPEARPRQAQLSADLKTALDKLKEQSVRLSKQLQMPVKSILALTTEQVGDGPDGTTLVAYAEQEKVDLWDTHSHLASNVWVDGLKEWARAGSHGAYF